MQRILIIIFTLLCFCSCADDQVVIGIAWREGLSGSSYVGTYKAIEAIGAKPILLGQVRSTDLRYTDGKIDSAHLDENDILLLNDANNIKLYTHSHSNAADVMQNIDAVVFTGGEDISPTLFAKPEVWHGIEAEKDFNTTRDVSDYLLLAYCIDNDIPTLCICRGAQMLGVVAGAPLIQDIPTYYAGLGIDYNYIHRYNKSNPDAAKEYISHPSVVTRKNSLFYDIIKADTLHGCPSWHHQAIGDLSNTSAVVTATTISQGVEIVEALEIPDKEFIVGVQFHPEYVMAKEDSEGKYMDKATTLRFFEALARAAK